MGKLVVRPMNYFAMSYDTRSLMAVARSCSGSGSDEEEALESSRRLTSERLPMSESNLM
jgi:hypothetical protein